jgi:hypothetical protein
MESVHEDVRNRPANKASHISSAKKRWQKVPTEGFYTFVQHNPVPGKLCTIWLEHMVNLFVDLRLRHPIPR